MCFLFQIISLISKCNGLMLTYTIQIEYTQLHKFHTIRRNMCRNRNYFRFNECKNHTHWFWVHIINEFFAFPSNFPNFLNSAIICNLNAVNAKHFACIHVFHIIWPYHACAQNAKAIFVGLAAFKLCSRRAETIIYRDLWIRFEQHCDNWFNWRANEWTKLSLINNSMAVSSIIAIPFRDSGQNLHLTK